MNYQRHYDRLIERSRDRVFLGYSERHHVVPRCLGGSNSSSNLVRLTAEEHFVAHQLLVKIYPSHYGLLWALSAMTNGTKNQERSKNKMYGWLRRELARRVSGRAFGRRASKQTRAKMSAARLGRKTPHSAETKIKISLASKGKQKSEEHRAALAAAKLGTKRGPHSPATRRKISETNRRTALLTDRSHMQSNEYRLLQSQRTREAWVRRKASGPPVPVGLTLAGG